MPAVLTYPGVYIEEVPSGVRTISGVATSIAAFVGRTKLGPVNEAVTVNSYGDFERIFGGLSVDSPLSFAVQDFFLNGGGQAVIVRLFKPLFASETLRLDELAAATTQAQTAADAIEQEASDAAADPANDDAGDVAAAVATAVPAASAPGKPAAAAAKAVADAVAASAKKKPTDKAAAKQAATDTKAEAVEAAAEAAAGRASARFTVGGLALEAASPGAWANDLRIRVDHDVFPEDDDKLFNLVVRAANGSAERLSNLSVDGTSVRRADHVLERESAMLRVVGDLPAAPPPKSGPPPEGKDPWGDHTPPSNFKVAEVSSDGVALEDADFTPTGADDAKTGLYALSKADIFNLLCIPPHSLGTSIGQGLIDKAIQYCDRRRAMLIIDPPAAWTSKALALAGLQADPPPVGTPHKNAAIYFPAILRPNPLRDNREEVFAPCGAVAGVIARTDTQRGIWKAPAGLDAALFNVPRLTVPLTDAENGELNIKGVNCLRSMPGAGRVVWGARTRRGDDRIGDEWKYISVRRTALYIEESLYRGTQWVVFEPNDEPLWASIRLNVGAFMNGMFRQGAFQGGSPRDAYFVKCDKDTTTQNDIDKGVVNILVGFAPLKPAEFVVIRLQQMAGQIQT